LGLRVWAGKLAFFFFRGTGWPCATTRRLGTEHWALDMRRTYRRRQRMLRRVGADELAQLPLLYTRSLRTVPRGNPDLIATFLVVDACDMNSVNANVVMN